MTDREKVMQALEHHEQGVCIKEDVVCPYWKHKECVSVLCKDALALLREQEKTKVVFKQYDGSVESECGNCGLYLDKTYSVCPKCGKELDWNA